MHKILKTLIIFEIIFLSTYSGAVFRLLVESKKVIATQIKELESKVNLRADLIGSLRLYQENSELARKEEKRINFCDAQLFAGLNEADKKFCFRAQKLSEARGIEIDLTNNISTLWDNRKIVKILPLLYQAPEDRWYQSPTGYYRIGVKKENHLSSIFPVFMPYAIQYYEDFFIHGVPYFEDGTKVSSNFTGGCLRFDNNIAEQIYSFLNKEDQIVVYKTLDDLILKSNFQAPVKIEDYWIRQRFGNPYRAFWANSKTENLRFDYYHHTGVDFAPNLDTEEHNIYAIYEGEVIEIQLNDGKDHGLGNTIILKHQIDGQAIFSLYAHLDWISKNLEKGNQIKKGEIIGVIGNSGQGCQNYWHIGQDGCGLKLQRDTHLHFEIKSAPVLENPNGTAVCQKPSGEPRVCYGYTPDYPQNYGYLNPIDFLFEKKPPSQIQ